MRTPFTLLLFIVFSFAGFAQKTERFNTGFTLFSLAQETDTINFILTDTLSQEVKPVLLWCQGSLPIPLFCDIEGYGPYFLGGGLSNFDYKAIAKDYHLVVISMPKTPVMAKQDELNKGFQYVPNPENPHAFSAAYLKADYLDNYVNRANAVLHYLFEQSWVDKNKLVIAGHSQGAKVATRIARTNAAVTHLGLFGANPFGRVDQMIREARLDAQLGKISWTEADSIINQNYDFYHQIHTPGAIESQPELKAWKSFSQPFIEDWLELDIPIYLAYGTEDQIADLCDIVPLFFIQEGKENLTLKRYIGLEHNFFEVGEDGRPDHQKAHWQEVIQAFIAHCN